MGENAALRFPDIAVEVDDVVEQDHQVVVRWRATATRGWDSWHLGALLQSLGAGPADVRL